MTPIPTIAATRLIVFTVLIEASADSGRITFDGADASVSPMPMPPQNTQDRHCLPTARWSFETILEAESGVTFLERKISYLSYRNPSYTERIAQPFGG